MSAVRRGGPVRPVRPHARRSRRRWGGRPVAPSAADPSDRFRFFGRVTERLVGVASDGRSWWSSRTFTGPTSPPVTCCCTWPPPCARRRCSCSPPGDRRARRHQRSRRSRWASWCGRAGRSRSRWPRSPTTGRRAHPPDPRRGTVGGSVGPDHGSRRGQPVLRRGARGGRRRRGAAATVGDLLLPARRRLDGPAREVLGIAAVIGRRVGDALLRHVVAADDAAIDGALREAVSQQLMVTAGDQYAFRHTLGHEAVYGDLLPGTAPRSAPSRRRVPHGAPRTGAR